MEAGGEIGSMFGFVWFCLEREEEASESRILSLPSDFAVNA